MLYQSNDGKVSVVRRAGWRPVRILGFPVKYRGALRQKRDLNTPFVTALTGAPEDLELLAESNCLPKGRLGEKRGGEKEETIGAMGRKRLRRDPPVDLTVMPILVPDDSEEEEVQDGGDGNVTYVARKGKQEDKEIRALIVPSRHTLRKMDGGRELRERSRLAAREAVKVKAWSGLEEDEEAKRNDTALFIRREEEPANKAKGTIIPTSHGRKQREMKNAMAKRTESEVFTGKESASRMSRESGEREEQRGNNENLDTASIEVATFRASPREVEAKRGEKIRATSQNAFERMGLNSGEGNEGISREMERILVDSLEVNGGMKVEQLTGVRDAAVEAGDVIAVKAELEGDLRRLRIDSSWSFKMLWEELQALFGIQGGFGIRYRDEEKDYVTIASDRDMRELFAIVLEYGLVPLRMKIVL